MKPVLNAVTAENLETLSKLMSEYRKEHGAKCRPSRELWRKAIDLCEQAPLVRVAESLGVSLGSLRVRRTRGQLRVEEKIQPRQDPFFEMRGLELGTTLLTPASIQARPLQGTLLSRQVKFTREDGSSLRISDLAAHGLDLRALIQGFMTPGMMEGGHR
jgi:hypothetical protein